MIHFDCVSCGKAIKTRPELAGKKVKCPKCGAVARVPADAASPVPAGGSAIPDDMPEEKTQAPIEPPPKMSLTDAPTAPPADARTKAPVAKDETFQAGKPDATRNYDAEDEDNPTDFLAPAQQPDEIGRLGPYRVLKILGRGGMGMVFQAEDPQLERKLALKVMLPALAASGSAKKRFLREAKTAAAIEHDHIVPIFQVGEGNGVPYIAMPFLQGEPLDDRLQREPPLPMTEVLRIGCEIAQGLAAAHGRGLIHRDIKPANIWLEASPGRKTGESRVKILDFGLARAASDAAHLTQSGAIVGTPAYMAPEQASGKPVDHRCDLFSLGCVLYRMCTGEMPFKGSDTIQILAALALEEPPPPDSLNADVPAELSDLVMELLAKKPEERPESAEAVVERLESLGRKYTGAAHGITEKPRLPREKTVIRRRGKSRTDLDVQLPAGKRWLWSAVGAMVVLVAVGVGAALWFSAGLPSARDGKPIAEAKAPEAPAAPFLDPTRIPAEERFEGQPPELVAVLGENRASESSEYAKPIFSPDGALVVTGRLGFRIWDAATLRFRGVHGAEANQCRVFAPKSRILAVGCESGLIEIWDLSGAKAEKLSDLKGETGNIVGLAFSPDGATLASATWSNATVRLWDMNTGKARKEIGKHAAQLYAVAYAPDGKTIASAGEEGSVTLWTVTPDGLKKKAVSKKDYGVVWSLAFSQDGKTVAARHFNGIVLWDPTGAELRQRRVLEHRGGWGQLALSSDGKWLAACSDQGHTALWDCSKSTVPEEFTLERAKSVSFSSDGKKLAARLDNGVVNLWDLSAKKPQQLTLTASGHRGPINSLAFAANGKTLASTGVDDTTRIWDLSGPAAKERFVLEGRSYPPYWLKFSQGDKSLFASAESNLLHWDLSERKPRKSIRLSPGGFMNSAAVDANGEVTLALTGENGYQMFEVSGKDSKKLPWPNPKDNSAHRAAGFGPDGKTFALQHEGIRLYEVGRGEMKETAQLLPPVQALPAGPFDPFAPDGKSVAVVNGPEIWLWDLAKPKTPFTFKCATDQLATVASTGKTLFAADLRGAIFVWDVDSGKTTAQWRLPLPVKCLAASADGTYLAAGCDGGAIYVLRPPPTDARK